MERHGGHLEAEAHQHQGETGQQHGVLDQDRGGQVGVDANQAGGTGGPVDQGDPVEQEGRGEGPEHEVLDGRLLGLDPPEVHGRQDIDGDGKHLEAQEQHDQIVGRGHDNPAGR